MRTIRNAKSRRDRRAEKRAKGARRFSRRLVALVASGVLMLGVGYGCYLWLRPRPPQPPVVDLTGTETDIAEAVVKARQRVQADPRSVAAWSELGMLLYGHGFFVPAAASFERLEQLDSGNPRWPHLRARATLASDADAAKILPLLERAANLSSDNPVPRMLLAEQLLEHGRDQEADRHFRQALECEPGNARAELGLGRVALVQGRLEDSREHLRRAAAKQPKARAAHALLAEVSDRLGDRAGAAKEQELMKRSPEKFEWPDPYWQEVEQRRVGLLAMLYRANALMEKRRTAESFRELEAAVAKYPHSKLAYTTLGELYRARSDLAAAERVYRAGVERMPDSADLQLLYALTLEAQRKHPAALEPLRQAIAIKPNSPVALCHLGWCQEQLGDPVGALESYRNAVRYKPDYGEGHKKLGSLLARLRQNAEALRHLRTAAELLPLDQSVRQLIEEIQSR